MMDHWVETTPELFAKELKALLGHTPMKSLPAGCLVLFLAYCLISGSSLLYLLVETFIYVKIKWHNAWCSILFRAAGYQDGPKNPSKGISILPCACFIRPD
jgi:hypothetical protein